jgi:p-cumate 2,3-dioxygenase subunit beta
MSSVTTLQVTVDPTLREIERFLYDEAALLDAWRLQDWVRLLSEDCRYLVPATDAVDAEHPERTMFIIADDYEQILGRVTRLESDQAFAERPRSRTRRLITNVRVDQGPSGLYEVHSNFAVYRFRRGVSDLFVGEYRHVLATNADMSYRITYRRATLDAEALRPQGKISFIL